MTERLFREGLGGAIYRVRVCPRELLGGGIDPVSNSLLFEEISGFCVLSTPVALDVAIADLNDYHLECLLGSAK